MCCLSWLYHPRADHIVYDTSCASQQFALTVMCRFLIDTFGRETLRNGSGVLDVAGGKGELSFELVNLNNIASTVVEPRALQLWRQHKWMLVSSSSSLCVVV